MNNNHTAIRIIHICCNTVEIGAGRTLETSSDNTNRDPEPEIQDTLPNIIFMMADDLGYGDVEYNGGSASTPNLNAMASGPNSIRLDRHYSGGPTCSPSRGTVLTGRNHNRYCIWRPNRVWGCGDYAKPTSMPLPTTEITVAEILKENGYTTGAFGKWHIGDVTPISRARAHPLWPLSHPGMYGFDTWWMTTNVVPTANPNHGCCGCFDKPCSSDSSYCRNYHSIDKNGSLHSWPEPINGDDSHFIYRRFVDFLENSIASGKPLFAYVAFHAPHRPHQAATKYKNPYLAKGKSVQQAHYLGIITAMDDVVGKIRRLLKERNVHRNTLLWFTSDNGPSINSPGSTGGLRGMKGDVYEGGIRVPGIIEWPAVIGKNRQSPIPVVTSDLLPTVCDILQVPTPADRQIDGDSVLPLLRGEKSTRNKSIAWLYSLDEGDFHHHQYYASLMRGAHKLVVQYADDAVGSAELYDLSVDRTESSDIKGGHQRLFESMTKELEQWRQSVIHSATEEVKCVGFSAYDTDHRCYSVDKATLCS